MKDLSNFPERLRELMFEHGKINADELAKKIGVYPSSVRMWLRGESLITLKNAVALADFFSCSLDYLAGMTERYETVAPREIPAFYAQLRKIMERLHVSRYRLVRDTEIKDVYLTKWSRGAIPDLISVIKIAEYLNVSLDYLVGRTDF